MTTLGKHETPPPVVIHREVEKRPYLDTDIDTAIDLVTQNAKLSRNDSKLLRFYAKSKPHSTPALSLVLRQTGIPDEKGWRRSRRKLEQLSLITYRNSSKRDHFISVNWVVICGLALLEKPLDVGGKSHKNFQQPIRCAMSNIQKQVKLSEEEYIATWNILALLPNTDLLKISKARVPQYPSIVYSNLQEEKHHETK